MVTAEVRMIEHPLVVEVSSQIVWTTDADGLVTDDSPSWRAFTGQSVEEWLDNRGFDMIHPDDLDGAIAGWRDAVAVPRPFVSQYRLWHVSGEYRWMTVRAVPVRAPDGSVRQWVGMLVDMNERKLEEQDAQQRLDMVEAVLDHLPVGTAFVGSDLVIRFVNRAYQTMRPERRMLGRHIGDVWPELRPALVSQCEHVIATSEPCSVVDEQFAVGLSGTGVIEYRYFSWTIRTTPMPRETVPGLLISVWETTERRQVENALRESQARLKRVVDGARDYAIIELDRHGDIVAWNAGAERLMGWNEDEILGRPAATLFTAEDRANRQSERELAQALATGSVENERWHVRKDGSRFWASGLLMTITDEANGGGPTGFVNVFQDRTLQREAAQALVDASRRKDEFLATLAHELRNPLAPIRSGLALLKSSDTAHAPRALAVMDRQLEHMVRLIDDLLEVSRISRGKIELHKERVEVRTVMEAALETSRPLLEAGGHDVTVTLPARATWLDADPTRIAQVISNLLNNAAKYTPNQGHVQLSAERSDEQVVIRVTDDGVGIAPEMIPTLFDMFTQAAPSRDRRQGGLGIGLSLAKSLVEMHDGTIEAHSKGRGAGGSTFVVRLPRASDPPREPAPDADEAPQGKAEGRCRILVVDDNEDAANMLAMFLEHSGHEVRVVHDGEAALAAARDLCPDVIFCDIGMPGMDGYEVARRLRADAVFAHTQLVAITGWGAQEDLQRSRQAGFDAHLTKPVAASAIEGTLAKIRETPGPPSAR